MSLYDMTNGVIRIDSMMNQISKAVFELKRLNLPGPFTVQLTQNQLTALRMETKNDLTYIEDKTSGWPIHGCKIEVVAE